MRPGTISIGDVAGRMKKKDIQSGMADALSEATQTVIPARDLTPAKLKKAEEFAKGIAASPDPEAGMDEVINKEKKSNNDKIYLALAATMPTILGAAFGGSEGGAIGANVTGKFFGDLSKDAKDDEDKRQAAQDKLDLVKAQASEREIARQEAQKDRESQAQMSREFTAGQRDISRQESRLDKQTAIEEVKKKSLLEVEDRYNTIEQNLTELQKMVKETGGFDFTGPQNKQMEQLIDSIAVDMAKLQDPSSVARESEVAQAKKLLFEPGFFQRQGNIEKVLNSFKEIAQRKKSTAYKVRGLEAPADISSQEAPQFEPDVLNYAKTHGITPEQAQIMKEKNMRRLGQ